MSPKKTIYILIALLHFCFLPFLKTPNFDTLSLLFSMLMLVSGILFLKNAMTPDHDAKIGKSDYFWILTITVVSLLISLNHLHDYSIWLDEHDEAKTALDARFLVRSTLIYSQMPLGYLWRKLGLLYTTLNEFNLRFPSVLAHTLFLIVMYFNFKKLTKDTFYSALGTLFLAFNFWLILYSVEARPYSISLFYFAVFIFFFIDEFFGAKESKHPNAALIFMTFFYLVSLAMQPLVLVITLLLFTSAVQITNRKMKLLGIINSLVCALLLFFPFFYSHLNFSASSMYPRPELNADYIKRVFDGLQVAKDMFLRGQLDSWLSAIFLLTLPLCLVLAGKNRKILLSVFSVSLVFLLGVVAGYKLLVAGYFQERYILTFQPLAFSLFFLSLFFAKPTAKKSTKWILASILLLAAAFSYSRTTLLKPTRKDWRGLYSEISDHTTSLSKAYIFSLHAPKTWCDEHFVAPEYYASANTIYPSTYQFSTPVLMNNDYLAADFDRAVNLSEVFFVIMKPTFSDEQFARLQIANTEKTSLTDFYLIKASASDLRNLTKDFYLQLDTLVTDENLKLRIYDGLYLVYLSQRDCKTARIYLAKYINASQLYAGEYDRRTTLHQRRFKEQCGLL